MADFQPFVPHGIIKLYRFVPLDESYQNTLHFKNRKQQLEYFDCLPTSSEITFPKADCKVSFSGQSFTRNERQYVRIEGNACNYYDCNYMAYQNEQFGEMWFFAFIHAVEYVNDYCTEITFEIDVMQSFMWNYELRECHVLREHSLTDQVGDSLTQEQIPNVAYKLNELRRTGWFNEYSICLVTAFDMDDLSPTVDPCFKKVGNMPFGGSIKTYASDDYDIVTEDLALIAAAGKLESIITIFLFPSHFTRVTEEIPASSYEINKMSYEQASTIDGYRPANNKLFTYPFTVLSVDCGNSEAVYKMELFNSEKCQFIFNPCLGAMPQIRMSPQSYDGGVTGNVGTDYCRSLTMENFPLVLYSGNNFANWWGQQGWAHGLAAVGDIALMVAGAATTVATSESGVGAVAGAKMLKTGVTGFLKEVGTVATAMTTPPTARSIQEVMSAFSTKQRDFYFKIIQPTNEGAKIIDDIFTMFGYATNRVKVPNVRNYDTCRPHFNYIQCNEMSFHWELFISEGKGTSVPQRYMSKILSIYQNGITFWKDPTEVGRYELLKYQNRPQ